MKSMSEYCMIVEEILRGINENQNLDAESKVHVLNIVLIATVNEVRRLKDKVKMVKEAVKRHAET